MAANDYIEDRVLSSGKEDALHHRELAIELARLVNEAEAPLHVALYGSWGSGKSSLRVLLSEELKKKSSTRIVYFDARKFADENLQRHFISQSAKSLGVKDDKFSSGLYQRKKRNDLSIPKGDSWKLIRLFLSLLAAGAVVVLVAAALGSAFSKMPFGTRFGEYLKSAIGPAFLSATFLSAIIALLGKVFSVDIEESEPSSSERFAALFSELVEDALKEHGVKRLLFYVDELDRRPAAEIVAVLETIRAFLDVDGCVFVVAADQKVLEEAISKAPIHSAPEDRERPYYSSGAEYLDKIFQHQMSIPPLSPQRLTDFAIGLVSGRSGVWTSADDLPTLVSVLIPSYCRSPRRVKVLLNGFVTLHRIVQQRYEADSATCPDPTARMIEIAKLSTLRLEFPLFYRDLEQHPRLARELTRYLQSDAWETEAKKRAEKYGIVGLVEEYAGKLRAVDVMLASRTTNEDSSGGETDSEETLDANVMETSDQRRRDELLRYLTKTSGIPGPDRDLIFLESAGSPFGLSAELADLIEIDAVDANVKAVLDRAEKMSESERVAAIRMLAATERDFHGIEATNALTVALALVDRDYVPTSDAAPLLVPRMADLARRQSLPLELLNPTLKLCLGSATHDARELCSRILRDQRLLQKENEDQALTALALAGGSDDVSPSLISQPLVKRPDGFLAKVAESKTLDQSRLVNAVGPRGLQILAERWKTGDEANEEQSADVAALASAANAADPRDFKWQLLTTIAKGARPDLIPLWLEKCVAHVETDEDLVAVLEGIAGSDRAQWPDLKARINVGTRTSNGVLRRLQLTLANDLSSNPVWDESSKALQAAIELSWEHPPWPADWKDVTRFEMDAHAWGTTQRLAKHQLLQFFAELSESDEAPWRDLLSASYVSAIGAGTHTPEQLKELMEGLEEDWLHFNSDQRSRITAAFTTGDSALPADAKRSWQSRLAHLDGGPALPFAESELSALMVGTNHDQDAARMWVRHWMKESGQVAAFIDLLKENAIPLNRFHLSFSQALIRTGPKEAADALCHLLKQEVAITEDSAKHLFKADIDESILANCLAELLRAAVDVQALKSLLDLWRLWSPTSPPGRKPLIEGLRVLSERGKEEFELVLENIVLAEGPPRGTKASLVSAIQERAKQHGLVNEAESAMAKAGLVRIKRSFGGLKRSVDTTEEEDD